MHIYMHNNRIPNTWSKTGRTEMTNGQFNNQNQGVQHTVFLIINRTRQKVDKKEDLL
jgi:lipid-binding SYLF domain-containing protein